MTENATSRYAWAADFEPNEAERKVLRCAEAGEIARFDGPAEIRGEFLKILLLCLRDDWAVAASGVHITRTTPDATAPRILGKLDLAFANAADGAAAPQLALTGCRFDDVVFLAGGRFASIDLRRSQLPGIEAAQCRIDRDIRLDDARIEGAVDFSGASIGGSFCAVDAAIGTADEDAVRLGGADIGESVFINRARIHGGVDCSDMQVNGEIAFKDARIINRPGDALRLDGSDFRRGIFLDGLTAIGQCDFVLMQTNGELTARGARFLNRGGVALRMDRAQIKGSVRLDKARFIGAFSAAGSHIESEFNAIDARFLHRSGWALAFDNASAISVFLAGAYVLGPSSFTGLKAKAEFNAINAKFLCPTGAALRLDSGAEIGAVYLCGALAVGRVVFSRSTINSINLSGGIFHSGESLVALQFSGATITDNLDLSGAVAGEREFTPAVINGCLALDHAHIGRQLKLSEAHFTAPEDEQPCLILRRARIDGLLETRALGGALDGAFDLAGAHIDTIDDDPETGWPGAGLLNIDGLTYRAIRADPEGGRETSLVVKRIAWLKRQYENGIPGRNEFRPQPFEQLSNVLRGQGHAYAATKIAIEKRELQRRCADRGFARLMHTILKITSDYGYSPARALAWFAGWITFGGVIAKAALNRGLYEPVADQTEPMHIEPISYAFDLATPIIDFGQASAYRLKPFCFDFGQPALCGALEFLEISSSTVGFVLFSILVLTLSGVMRGGD